MDVAQGNCEWPDNHPPHLWADELRMLDGSAKIKLFACTGSNEEEDI